MTKTKYKVWQHPFTAYDDYQVIEAESDAEALKSATIGGVLPRRVLNTKTLDEVVNNGN